MALEREDIQDLIDALKGGTKNTKQVQEELSRRAKTIEQYKKLNEELLKAIREGKAQSKLSQKQRDLIDQVNDAYDDQYKILERNNKIQKDINEVGKRLTDSLFGLGDAQTKGADRIEYYTRSFETFPFVGKAVNEFGKSLDFNVDVFKSLASLGADFSSSLVNLRIGSQRALLPLLEFVDLVQNNSNNLALLFGTVNQGTNQLSRLSRLVREDVLQNFAGFGVTTDEINEYLTTFLSLQRIQGRQEFRDTQATTEALRSYTGELDKVAKLTGIQRQELDKAVRAQQADAVLQSYLAGLAPQRRQEVQTFIAGLQSLSPALGGAVSNILATGFPLGEFEQNLVALNPGLMDSIQAFKDGTLSSEEFNNRLRTIANSTQRFGSGLLRANENVLAVTNALLPLRGTTADLNELQKERSMADKGATREIILLQESFRRFKSEIEGIQTVFLQETLPSLASGFKLSYEGIEGLRGTINKMVTDTPGAIAAGLAGVTALKYTANYAKEVGIVAAGTAIGTSKMQNALVKGGIGLGKVGMVGAGAGLAYASGELAGSAETAGGKALGVLGSAGSGALAGAAFGPWGALIGGLIGAGYGAYQAFSGPERAIGGPLSANQLALVGERGPELFLPSTSGAIEPIKNPTITTGEQKATSVAQMSKFEQMFGEQNAAFKQFADLSVKMEKHLNTLVGITAKTETNTGNTVRRLANLGENLV
jgi:hypothetical protein